MTKRKRKTHSPECKARVALEALKGIKPIHEIALARPYYGTRRMAHELRPRRFEIRRERTRRLMRRMRLTAIYPKPRTSLKSPDKRVYPCLLRDLDISTKPGPVLGSATPTISMGGGVELESEPSKSSLFRVMLQLEE